MPLLTGNLSLPPPPPMAMLMQQQRRFWTTSFSDVHDTTGACGGMDREGHAAEGIIACLPTPKERPRWRSRTHMAARGE